jgi:hypothetical protein
MRASIGLLPLSIALVVGAALRTELAGIAPPFLVANDSADYFTAGYTVLQSGELQLSLKRTPLYPLFLAGLIQTVGPSLDRLLTMQHLLGLVTIGLTYLLGRLAFGTLAAGVAALAVAINGSLLTMERLLISEALYTPLLLATLAALIGAVRSGHMALWLLAGILLGLGTLCRPLGIGVLLVALVALPFTAMPRGRRLRGTGLLLLGAAICVAPWIVRQSLVHDRAVVNGGLGDAMFSRVRRYDPTFALRDDGRPVPEADRAIRARIFELAPQYEYPREIRAVLRQELGIGDVEADRILRDVAWTVISQDPGRYVLGTLSMTGRLLRGSDPGLVDLWISVERDRVLQGWPASLRWALATEHPRDDTVAFYRARWLLAIYRDDLWSGVPVLALAPLGAAWAFAAHRRSGAAMIPLVVLSQIVLYVALDGPLFRYRFPYQPLVIILGAAGLALVVRCLVTAWREAQAEILKAPDAALAPAAAPSVPHGTPQPSAAIQQPS